MKRLLYLLTGVVLLSMTSCYDDYKEDFESSSVYFPHQQPLRKIWVNDPEIEVGVVLGGKRENNANELVAIELAPELLPDDVTLLPSEYYSTDLPSDNTVTIPAGSFNGLFNLSFTDAFYADELSLTNH